MLMGAITPLPAARQNRQSREGSPAEDGAYHDHSQPATRPPRAQDMSSSKAQYLTHTLCTFPEFDATQPIGCVAARPHTPTVFVTAGSRIWQINLESRAVEWHTTLEAPPIVQITTNVSKNFLTVLDDAWTLHLVYIPTAQVIFSQRLALMITAGPPVRVTAGHPRPTNASVSGAQRPAQTQGVVLLTSPTDIDSRTSPHASSTHHSSPANVTESSDDSAASAVRSSEDVWIASGHRLLWVGRLQLEAIEQALLTHDLGQAERLKQSIVMQHVAVHATIRSGTLSRHWWTGRHQVLLTHDEGVDVWTVGSDRFAAATASLPSLSASSAGMAVAEPRLVLADQFVNPESHGSQELRNRMAGYCDIHVTDECYYVLTPSHRVHRMDKRTGILLSSLAPQIQPERLLIDRINARLHLIAAIGPQGTTEIYNNENECLFVITPAMIAPHVQVEPHGTTTPTPASMYPFAFKDGSLFLVWGSQVVVWEQDSPESHFERLLIHADLQDLEQAAHLAQQHGFDMQVVLQQKAAYLSQQISEYQAQHLEQGHHEEDPSTQHLLNEMLGVMEEIEDDEFVVNLLLDPPFHFIPSIMQCFNVLQLLLSGMHARASSQDSASQASQTGGFIAALAARMARLETYTLIEPQFNLGQWRLFASLPAARLLAGYLATADLRAATVIWLRHADSDILPHLASFLDMFGQLPMEVIEPWLRNTVIPSIRQSQYAIVLKTWLISKAQLLEQNGMAQKALDVLCACDRLTVLTTGSIVMGTASLHTPAQWTRDVVNGAEVEHLDSRSLGPVKAYWASLPDQTGLSTECAQRADTLRRQLELVLLLKRAFDCDLSVAQLLTMAPEDIIVRAVNCVETSELNAVLTSPALQQICTSLEIAVPDQILAYGSLMTDAPDVDDGLVRAIVCAQNLSHATDVLDLTVEIMTTVVQRCQTGSLDQLGLMDLTSREILPDFRALLDRTLAWDHLKRHEQLIEYLRLLLIKLMLNKYFMLQINFSDTSMARRLLRGIAESHVTGGPTLDETGPPSFSSPVSHDHEAITDGGMLLHVYGHLSPITFYRYRIRALFQHAQYDRIARLLLASQQPHNPTEGVLPLTASDGESVVSGGPGKRSTLPPLTVLTSDKAFFSALTARAFPFSAAKLSVYEMISLLQELLMWIHDQTESLFAELAETAQGVPLLSHDGFLIAEPRWVEAHPERQALCERYRHHVEGAIFLVVTLNECVKDLTARQTPHALYQALARGLGKATGHTYPVTQEQRDSNTASQNEFVNGVMASASGGAQLPHPSQAIVLAVHAMYATHHTVAFWKTVAALQSEMHVVVSPVVFAEDVGVDHYAGELIKVYLTYLNHSSQGADGEAGLIRARLLQLSSILRLPLESKFLMILAHNAIDENRIGTLLVLVHQLLGGNDCMRGPHGQRADHVVAGLYGVLIHLEEKLRADPTLFSTTLPKGCPLPGADAREPQNFCQWMERVACQLVWIRQNKGSSVFVLPKPIIPGLVAASDPAKPPYVSTERLFLLMRLLQIQSELYLVTDKGQYRASLEDPFTHDIPRKYLRTLRGKRSSTPLNDPLSTPAYNHGSGSSSVGDGGHAEYAAGSSRSHGGGIGGGTGSRGHLSDDRRAISDGCSRIDVADSRAGAASSSSFGSGSTLQRSHSSGSRGAGSSLAIAAEPGGSLKRSSSGRYLDDVHSHAVPTSTSSGPTEARSVAPMDARTVADVVVNKSETCGPSLEGFLVMPTTQAMVAMATFFLDAIVTGPDLPAAQPSAATISTTKGKGKGRALVQDAFTSGQDLVDLLMTHRHPMLALMVVEALPSTSSQVQLDLVHHLTRRARVQLMSVILSASQIGPMIALATMTSLPLEDAFNAFKSGLATTGSRDYSRLQLLAQLGYMAGAVWRQRSFMADCEGLARDAGWWRHLRLLDIPFDDTVFRHPELGPPLKSRLLAQLLAKCGHDLELGREYCEDYHLSPEQLIKTYISELLKSELTHGSAARSPSTSVQEFRHRLLVLDEVGQQCAQNWIMHEFIPLVSPYNYELINVLLDEAIRWNVSDAKNQKWLLETLAETTRSHATCSQVELDWLAASPLPRLLLHQSSASAAGTAIGGASQSSMAGPLRSLGETWSDTSLTAGSMSTERVFAMFPSAVHRLPFHASVKHPREVLEHEAKIDTVLQLTPLAQALNISVDSLCYHVIMLELSDPAMAIPSLQGDASSASSSPSVDPATLALVVNGSERMASLVSRVESLIVRMHSVTLLFESATQARRVLKGKSLLQILHLVTAQFEKLCARMHGTSETVVLSDGTSATQGDLFSKLQRYKTWAEMELRLCEFDWPEGLLLMTKPEELIQQLFVSQAPQWHQRAAAVHNLATRIAKDFGLNLEKYQLGLVQAFLSRQVVSPPTQYLPSSHHRLEMEQAEERKLEEGLLLLLTPLSQTAPDDPETEAQMQKTRLRNSVQVLLSCAYQASSKIPTRTRLRALRVLFRLAPTPVLGACGIDYVGTQQYMQMLYYLMDFEELKIVQSLKDFASCPKGALSQSLWLQHRQQPKVLQLVCNIMLDYDVMDEALWERVLRQLLAHGMTTYVLGVLNQLVNSPCSAAVLLAFLPGFSAETLMLILSDTDMYRGIAESHISPSDRLSPTQVLALTTNLIMQLDPNPALDAPRARLVALANGQLRAVAAMLDADDADADADPLATAPFHFVYAACVLRLADALDLTGVPVFDLLDRLVLADGGVHTGGFAGASVAAAALGPILPQFYLAQRVLQLRIFDEIDQLRLYGSLQTQDRKLQDAFLQHLVNADRIENLVTATCEAGHYEQLLRIVTQWKTYHVDATGAGESPVPQLMAVLQQEASSDEGVAGLPNEVVTEIEPLALWMEQHQYGTRDEQLTILREVTSWASH